MSHTQLVLERRDQANETGTVGPVSFTPPISEDYWAYRVVVGEGQAVVGFPKFSTIGIGFAVEEDWNTNLPYSEDIETIYGHILHNKGDAAIPDTDIREAIGMIRAAVIEDVNMAILERLGERRIDAGFADNGDLVINGSPRKLRWLAAALGVLE